MRRQFAALLIPIVLSSCESLNLDTMDFLPLNSVTTVSRSSGGEQVARTAMSWDGKRYKDGQTKRCADWVGYVVRKAGYTPPSGYMKCSNWMEWGGYVPRSSLKAGDIVIFKGTYKAGISHIGISIGGDRFIHRPTKSAPVRITDLSRYQIAGIRRPK